MQGQSLGQGATRRPRFLTSGCSRSRRKRRTVVWLDGGEWAETNLNGGLRSLDQVLVDGTAADSFGHHSNAPVPYHHCCSFLHGVRNMNVVCLLTLAIELDDSKIGKPNHYTVADFAPAAKGGCRTGYSSMHMASAGACRPPLVQQQNQPQSIVKLLMIQQMHVLEHMCVGTACIQYQLLSDPLPGRLDERTARIPSDACAFS